MFLHLFYSKIINHFSQWKMNNNDERYRADNICGVGTLNIRFFILKIATYYAIDKRANI